MCVFFVEDDDMIGDSVCKGLCYDGFVIDWVCDGEVVVYVVIVFGVVGVEFGIIMFDFMLFDFGLFKCDGLDVVCEVCQCGIVIFILIFIVCDVVVDCVVGFNVGVDDYLVKLFDLQELVVCMYVLLCR